MSIEYSISEDVYAFTSCRFETLPFEVTVGHQVHGNAVAVVDRIGMTCADLDGFDALITNLPGCAIGVRTADCIPIFLYDKEHKAIAAVHSGWKGTLQRIVKRTIAEMQLSYRTEASEIIAFIGPGICKTCFQVGEEVVKAFRDTDFSLDAVYSWDGPKKQGDISTGHHIDLIEANRQLLLEAGLRPENISDCGICTYEDERLFSARREGQECGRNINAIMIL